MSRSEPFYLDSIVRGNTESKLNILVVAGVHGNEHNAVLAAYRLYRALEDETDPNLKPKHKVRFLLGLNTWGLLNSTREWGTREDVYPDPLLDEPGIDFNRVFDEKYAETTAKEARDRVIDAIESSDIVIDVHNSPACENMVVINNDEYAASTVKFLDECHMDRYMVRESTTGTIKKYATSRGKAAFTVELGGMTLGPLDGSVMIDQAAYLKTLVSLLDARMPRFEKGKPLPPWQLAMAVPARAFGMIDDVKFSRHVEMKAGEVFATMVTDSDNPDDRVFRAPCDGRLVACMPTRFVKPGDEIFTWQPTVKK